MPITTHSRSVGSPLTTERQMNAIVNSLSSAVPVEAVLVSGIGACAELVLYVGGGLGRYIYQSSPNTLTVLDGMGEYLSFLAAGDRSELKRKRIKVNSQDGFRRSLESVRRGQSLMSRSGAYGLGMFREIAFESGNWWEVPSGEPKNDREARAMFEKMFGAVRFKPTYAMDITNAEMIGPAGLGVLKELLAGANLDECTITSAFRGPKDQARVMYDNIKKHSVDKQMGLYGWNGQQVVKVYQANVAKSRTDVIELMRQKIVALGPTNVSHHALTTHDVFDVAPSSIDDKARFVSEIKAHKSVSKYVLPPKDPAFHIEVPKVGN